MKSTFRSPSLPYEPNLGFDWVTGGRELSEEEREILRKVMLDEKVKDDADRNHLR
jgi:hypothetical protein